MGTPPDLLYPNADDRAHENGDHSACGADNNCHEIWLAEVARSGQMSNVQVHTNERHHLCPSSWRCHQIWNEAEEEHSRLVARVEQQSQMVVPLEADGGERVDATVQHDGMHPHILEIRKGDILLVPAPIGPLSEMTPETRQELMKLGVQEVLGLSTLTAPFVLRKAAE